ncbi:conserved hypothetical protein [Ricinus communis]|uniref:Uncharacterized protein n=2 Tax=Ricinus communis TaxID=3988 RepID=B9SUP5_RICCO|nr:conserved hypothetical protein [Ricinus communis]|eukprot:XP_002529714.1 uncharacterized protein LOC8264250 [Ricinus communis]
MDTREYWSLDPVQENHGFNYDDGDYDDALSLCDLALHNNSNASDWDDSSKEDQSSSFDQDLFEFFSEDFTASAYPKDNIIFCGKLIPYKGDKEEEQAHNLEKAISKPREGKRSRIFPWKTFSSSRSTRSKSYTTCKTFPDLASESNEYGMKRYNRVSMKKVSLLGGPARSRWYLFAFGVGRYPMEMELSDIKTRQSKLTDSKMRQSSKAPGKSKADDGREKLDGRGGKRARGWWSLLRILGCKGNQANAMVKASLGLMPLPNV